ncbi:hypothetical protein C8F04DRAFT_1189104 [Mycena alexandri]|uniref:Uncharacterized protein n=1 Tax=Mycena alexandri TaxID=1745969 RepID=A0AAD6WYB9_9AGAR|nr:hypothetical protein C8F04DRAFT_1189104 [Mycena alexandri]
MAGNPSAAPWRLRLPEKVDQDDEEWGEGEHITPLAPIEWLSKWQEDKAQWEAERENWQREHPPHKPSRSAPSSSPPRSTSPREATRPKRSVTRPEPSPTEREAAPPERDVQQDDGWGRRLWDRYFPRARRKSITEDRPDAQNDTEDCFKPPSRPAGQNTTFTGLSSFTPTSVPPRVFGDSSSNDLQMDMDSFWQSSGSAS